MKQFQLYVLQGSQKILLTDYSLHDSTSKFNVTYDEQLSESENDQFSLTFSIAKKMRPSSKLQRVWAAQHIGFNQEQQQLDTNPWLNVVKMGAKLQLVIDNIKTINLIVSSVAPQITKHNVVYNFTAQDECSYLWPKHNLGYFFPQTDEEEGAHNIVYFLQHILQHNHLASEWSVFESSNLPLDLFSFSVDGSNLYNAIIEACNVLGYQIKVDYVLKHIIPYIPDKNAFSGYRYRPETNQKSLSVSYDGSELCTLMHVTGGEDAYEQNIPLVPVLPQPFKQYFAKTTGWTTTTWENIEDKNYYSGILAEMQTTDAVTEKNGQYTTPTSEDNLQYFLSNDTAVLADEMEECKTFCSIADKVPYLGQFLCDFSFFKSNGLFTNSTQLTDTLNQMRINNTWLKIYTPSYYSILYEITKRNAQLEVYAEQYEAECKLMAEKITNETMTDATLAQHQQQLSEIVNSITKLFSKDYFNLFRKVYGTKSEYYKSAYINWYRFDTRVGRRPPSSGYYYSYTKMNLYPEWQKWVKNMESADEQYELYKNKAELVQKKIDKLPTDTVSLDTTKIALESELVLYEQSMDTYKTLGNSWLVGQTEVPGKWSLMLGLMQLAYHNLSEELDNVGSGLIDKIDQYEFANKVQEQKFYSAFGQYIYESSYENTDELDSVGLYNQAVQNFALYNKPQASYSLTTIDLNCLQQIAVPNITVGSKIRIYNEPLDLDDGKVNNIQYTNNEVIITAISRNLRSNDDVQLTVTKTNKIDTLVQKLLINIKEM